jgi:hypothetical protein
MQKHKNDLISKLEGKTSAMAETLRKLDDKYVDFSLMSCFKINLFIIYSRAKPEIYCYDRVD